MRRSNARLSVGLLLLAVASSASADSKKIELRVFRIGGKYYRFIHIRGKYASLSEDCKKERHRLSCDAYDALKHASVERIKNRLAPGADRGERICVDVGGSPVVGYDDHDNENLICEFTDGSKTTTGSLEANGILYDEAHE